MTTFTPLADAEKLALAFLGGLFAPMRWGTEIPADLVGALPFGQVSRFGGASPSLTLDAANLDFDYFDGPHDGKSAYENAASGVAQVRTALLYHSQGYTHDGGAIQRVTEISAPRWVPYDNTNVRRFTAAYRITIHSIPS